MGLHITLGGESSRGPFQPIYIGDSAAAARAAESGSVLPWILRLDNPPVVRKHNALAEANATAAPIITDPAPSEDSPPEPTLRPRRK